MAEGGARVKWNARLHVALVVAVSVAFESLFIQHGLNALDEGWPLYAAMQLQEGGRLYRDVFFVFPPGHLLPAWIAHCVSPPGVLLARIFYASFAVALCAALYALGRRITTPGFALLGAALVAVAAPDSHASHLLFGYRYLVFSALALWCFAERLRTGRVRWMLAAGALAGLALVFRFDAAAAVSVGIAAGALATRSGWRTLSRDAAGYAIGVAAVVLPVVAYFATGVGLETLWREVVVRPLEMTRLQSLAVPSLERPPRWTLWEIRLWFVAFQFRLWAALYAAYAIGLVVQLVRSFRTGRRFDSPLLLAVVVWGGVFYLRSFGRADEPHLDSAVPPACLLLGHAVGVAASRLHSAGARAALGVATFTTWLWLTALPHYLNVVHRGSIPLETLGRGVAIHPRSSWRELDELVEFIQSETAPDEVILDLSASPLLHVVARRRGPGGAELVMPGTFLTREEELAMLERLERSPPALVVLSRRPFDNQRSRGLAWTAPHILAWIDRHYAERRSMEPFVLLGPRPAASEIPASDAARSPPVGPAGSDARARDAPPARPEDPARAEPPPRPGRGAEEAPGSTPVGPPPTP